jgi:hypothetical protein
MAPGTGCTQILPRSHRLQLPVPDDDAGLDSGVEDFLPRMEDVVVWDQRVWHRRGAFTPQSEDDVRVVMIPSFNINQVFFAPEGIQLNGPNFVGSGLKRMPKSVVREWLHAASRTAALTDEGQTDEEPGGAMQQALLLGGRWDPAVLFRHMLELSEDDPGIKAYLDNVVRRPQASL